MQSRVVAPATKQKTVAPIDLALTVEEFAASIRISRAGAFNEIKAGRLRTFRIGSRRLVALEDARAYVEARRAESAS